MGSAEQERRRQLKNAYKSAEHAARRARMPLTQPQLTALVVFVDQRVVADDCDHTTRFAERWAEQHGVDWAPLEEGLHEFDGYCDCEIVMNAGPEVVFR
ncbi:DUF2695 domain-containing protein [Dactylosporangium sp. NPDC050688]|uniref:DUF2695 domain-containing protein n=1 Tax=Dactylosporangium sp. NPDC050688 TaxID=3157217 RepID=UPI0033DBE54D